MIADRFIRLIVGFGVGVLVARHFGPEDFGQLSYVVATASVFGALSSMGLDDIVPREIASRSGGLFSTDDIQKTALYLRLIGGLSAYTFLLIAVFLTSGWSLTFAIAAVFGLYFPLQATDVYEYRMRVEGEYAGVARTRVYSSILSAIAKTLVVFFSLPLVFLAAAMTFEYGLVAFGFRKLALALEIPESGRFNSKCARHLLAGSWKIALAGIVVMLQARVEYFLVELYLGWGSVGQYASAIKIFELFDMACIVLANVLLPELAARNAVADKVLCQRAYLAGIFVYLGLLPAMFVVLWLFPMLYGTKYDAAASILPLLFLRPLFGMANSIRNMLIVLDQKYSYPVVAALIGLGASVAFGAWLIPAYGLMGAAINTIIGLFFYTIVADALFYRKSLKGLLRAYQQIGFFQRKLLGGQGAQ